MRAKKVYVRFDSDVVACLFPTALKIVVGEHLEEDPDAVDTIDDIDFVIQGLIRLGLDDDGIQALISRRLGSVHAADASQSSNDL